MGLRLEDKWLWDFWLAKSSADYHVFYLQASRSLGDPELRHWNVSIGHAVSKDLRVWEVLPDALQPDSDEDAWDGNHTWTGSIIRHGGLWYQFYTGGKRSEKGLVQRVGLAGSTDLIEWQKHPHNPLITADQRWYEPPDLKAQRDQAWRDPWIFRYRGDGDFHAFITARSKNGPSDERGVIGHARSTDLIHWEVLPPVTEPGEFSQMEVPQLVEIHGRYYLLFCTQAGSHSETRKQRIQGDPVTGTHYLVSDSALGPYRYISDEFLVGDEVGSLYAGKLVQGPDNRWYFMAWKGYTSDGNFLGELSDPMLVNVRIDGKLSVQR